MTPVIRHLRANFLELPLPAAQQPLNWTFDASIKKLGPDFYRQIIPLHPVLNLEYSVLCHQIRHNLSFPDKISHDQIINQLTAALMLAELLEHLHNYYLIVPREVVRLRRQQQVYRNVLVEIAGYSFSSTRSITDTVPVGLSLSQQIRENTAFANWYRLLLTRSKRLLNFLDLVGTGSDAFRHFVTLMDQYTNPFFAYVSWCFFIPRLLTNLFLIAKHTIPGFWMNEEEKSLGWLVRLHAQIQRRWFELANDIVWITVGLLNCFVLTGVLAPVAAYLTLAAFAFDMVSAGLRAYIELQRLYKLEKEYALMYQTAATAENKDAIQDYQAYLSQRINFEILRLSLSVAATSAVFLAMCLAAPALAFNPIIPLIGAFLLMVIWIASFALTRSLENYRPNDTIEKPSNVVKLGFFAKKPKELSPVPCQQEPVIGVGSCA